MRHVLLAGALCAVALAGGGVASARAQVERSDGTEERVKRLVGLALSNIQRASCGGAPCAPATSAELAAPPVSQPEARIVVGRGILSAAGEACSLDWRKLNFLPMMSYWRDLGKNERQMALIGLLHGIVQGQSKDRLPPGLCTEPAKLAKLQRDLAFKP